MAKNRLKPGEAVLIAAVGFLVAAINPSNAVSEEKPATVPFLGDKAAIAEGRTIYRSRCYICHLSNGGRGPNLFATRLTPDQFVATVAAGRGIMPALGTTLSADEIWKVHAFIRSTDKYE